MIISVSDDKLKVCANTNGATLSSVKRLRDGREFLWQGSEDSWTEQDVVIFPFVARQKDGWYTVDGKRYDIPLHGLCRHSDFTENRVSDRETVLTNIWNEETLKKNIVLEILPTISKANTFLLKRTIPVAESHKANISIKVNVTCISEAIIIFSHLVFSVCSIMNQNIAPHNKVSIHTSKDVIKLLYFCDKLFIIKNRFLLNTIFSQNYNH